MIKEKFFKRRIENFICDYCGYEVKGSGYTDHCPNCLYSKHVDNNPGDRKCNCRGLMEPLGIIDKNGIKKIYYVCLKCSYRHVVKVAKDDNLDRILELSVNPIIYK